MSESEIGDVYEVAARAYYERLMAGAATVSGDFVRRLVADVGFRAAVDAVVTTTRAGVLRVAARALLDESKVYNEKWCRGAKVSQWDEGYVRGMESAAHTVANSISRGAVNTVNKDGDS